MACVSCCQILQYLHNAHACNTQKTRYTWALFEVHFISSDASNCRLHTLHIAQLKYSSTLCSQTHAQ